MHGLFCCYVTLNDWGSSIDPISPAISSHNRQQRRGPRHPWPYQDGSAHHFLSITFAKTDRLRSGDVSCTWRQTLSPPRKRRNKNQGHELVTRLARPPRAIASGTTPGSFLKRATAGGDGCRRVDRRSNYAASPRLPATSGHPSLSITPPCRAGLSLCLANEMLFHLSALDK